MMALPWKIEELVPHTATMSLLDEALSADEEDARAAVRIAEDSLLYDSKQGGVPAWAGVEYMAQTIAMFAGAQARHAGGRPAVGFLLGTRRFIAHVPCYKLASRLEVAVTQEFRDDQMAVFDCRISCRVSCQVEGEENVLAEARLSVFQPDDIAEFLGMDE